MPPALARKPEVTIDLHVYIEAFFTLSSFRSPGFSGPGPLLFADILRYAELVGYTTNADRLFFVEVIQGAESAYQAHVAKKQASQQAAAKKKSGTKPKAR